MCLTWNRWNIIIFLFLLLQGGGHFWKKKLVKTVGVLVCLKQHTGSYWLHSGMCRVAEMHCYSATKAKRVFSFSTCHIGPNEWINNIVVPSFTIRCSGLCSAHWSRFQIFCSNTICVNYLQMWPPCNQFNCPLVFLPATLDRMNGSTT